MATKLSTDLARRIEQATGVNVFLCYHCVKCTSGCPLMEYFDLAPNQIMRAAQLGLEDLIFDSITPWLCASCQTCTTRCPQGIDIARVMDFLVSDAMAKGIKPKVPEVALFNKVFLRDANILGRAYELGLMVEMNLRTLKPFKDLDMGFEMIKRGKVRFIPDVVLRRKRRKKAAPADHASNEIGYYPGCSLHAMAAEFNHSTHAVLEQLGIKAVEPSGWTCCGSTPAHRVDHELAVRLPMQNMILYEQEGLREMVLPCASCFSRFRAAAQDLRLQPELKAHLEHEIGVPYEGKLDILSLVDMIHDRIGLEAVAAQVNRPLEGLKVACYYGCLLTRPPAVTGSENPEYPMEMDYLMQALGATTVDWDYKVACCGGSLAITRRDIVLKLSKDILQNALSRGADMIVVACPLCHNNLDGRQMQMGGDLAAMPILYFTQLMALAFGLRKQAGLKRNLVDPHPVLAERGILE
jgi:heterodisulfide reductase subunit B